jgi:hypothetical protein
MTSNFYFTATSWFPGNVRVKPHSKHSASRKFLQKKNWIWVSLIYKLSKIPLILKQAPVSHLLSIGLLIQWSRVGFRVSKGRDVPGQTGAGRPVVPLSRDKKVSLSRCPFVPGQKSFACPVVPLSRDNEGTSVPLSLCPKKFCCPVPLETLVRFPSPAVFF